MSNHTAHFTVDLSRQTGSLERLLSRVRRRGFQVENMIVTGHQSSNYRIELRLAGQRSFETLAKHLANLADVFNVSLQIPSSLIEYSKKLNPAVTSNPMTMTS
ncbi:MAG: ACT domain-containing protein [Planctomycetota bacterium]